jgi:transcriptional regulator with XRE-family HTH domain
MATVGDQIRSARHRRQWTQKQLADAVGVNVKTVDNWENGRTSPKNRLGAVEEVLGLRLGDEPTEPEELTSADPRIMAILRNPVFTDEERAWMIEALPPRREPRQQSESGSDTG